MAVTFCKYTTNIFEKQNYLDKNVLQAHFYLDKNVVISLMELIFLDSYLTGINMFFVRIGNCSCCK